MTDPTIMSTTPPLAMMFANLIPRRVATSSLFCFGNYGQPDRIQQHAIEYNDSLHTNNAYNIFKQHGTKHNGSSPNSRIES